MDWLITLLSSNQNAKGLSVFTSVSRFVQSFVLRESRESFLKGLFMFSLHLKGFEETECVHVLWMQECLG